MIKLTQRLNKKSDTHTDTHDPVQKTIQGQLTLTIEQRVHSRLRVTLDDGRDAGIFLPRGTLLRGGDLLSDNTGMVIEVVAAAEKVSTLHCENSALLTRAAYHLGNRHIPLQIEKKWLRYPHDHVLDEMVKQMGLDVLVEKAPFEPEAGAYQQTPHDHHDHDHDHEHEHDPTHRHTPSHTQTNPGE